MSGGAFDQAKGRVKQAAGELTDDEDLERKGEVDEATGKLKDKADDAKDKVTDALDAVRDKVNDDDR
jgi:uncharacterized protein YjbJ (UPF0337 family)